MRYCMIIEKQQLRDFVEDLPDRVDLEEVHRQLYLREKVEVAEDEVQPRKLLSYDEVIAHGLKWFGD